MNYARKFLCKLRSFDRFSNCLLGIFLFGLWLGALSANGQSIQLQCNSTVNVPNPGSVASCSAITMDVSYGVVSPTNSALGAKISLPLKGLALVSVGSNPDIASSQVVGTAPNDTLVINMVSPLAAGSSGNVSIQVQFPCGTTCSGTTSSLQARFTATNVSNPVSSGTTSLTATAINPNYQVNLVQTSYNATTRRSVFSVRVTPTTTPTNFMPLDSPVLSLTVPAGAVIRQYGTSGTRTTIPNNLPATSFTPTAVTSVVGSTTTVAWSNIPIFHRGGRLDVTNFDLEFPASSFPYGTVVSIPTAITGLLGVAGCNGTTSDTGLNTFTITAPGSTTAGATGCSGQQMITGLNNPWNAVFRGKINQTRISVPISNTGNVSLSNLTYTIAIPTNELSVTQVSGSGTSGVSGTAFYRTNLNSLYVSVGTVGQGVTTRTFPTTFLPGEYITEVRVTLSSLAPAASMTVNVFGNQLSPLRNGSAVNAAPLTTFMASTTAQNSCFGGYTCMTVSSTVTAEYNGSLVLDQSCSSSRVIVQPTSGIQNFAKQLPTTASSYVPGQVYQYRIRFTPVTVGDSLRNLVITDVLPATLEFAGNVKYSHSSTAPTGVGSFSVGTSLPTFTRSGQTLIWSWAANSSPNNRIYSTADHYLFFDVRIKAGAAVGTIQNCATVTGTNMYTVAGVCQNITVSSLAKMDAIKWVRGDLDRNYIRYPHIGHTTDGGKSDYRFVLINSGNVAFKNITLIDIFPWVGDQIVAADFARLSEWRPSLLQSVRFYPKAAADSSKVQSLSITAPSGVTVTYSTQANPCRTEFSPAYNPSGCVTAGWTTTPPAALSATQAIKVVVAGPFAAGDTLVFGVDMRSPLGTPLDKVAWNSFAYQAIRNDNSVILPIAEPNKVGIDVKRFPGIGNYVWQDLNNNGIQDEVSTAGLNGVTVQLWSPGGDGARGGSDDFLIGTKLTANDGQGNPGYYLFDSLYAESYYLRFLAPAGKGFTFQNVTSTSDSLINSNADYGTGYTALTELEPNERDLSWDAGLCTIPNAGPNQVVCAPTTAVKLPNATGNDLWYSLGTNPPGATINAQTGQVTGLSAGIYQFILRSSPGCSDTVTVNRRPSATALTPTVAVCTGESVTLTAQSAGASATYRWTGPNNFSATGISAVIPNSTTAQSGSYTLTVTDTGCQSTTTVSVTVNPVPTLTVGNNGPLSCGKASVQLTASGTGSSYSWSGPNAYTANTATAFTNQPGAYTAVATTSTGCTAVAVTTAGQDNTPPQLTAQPTSCTPSTNQYSVNGTVTLSQPGNGPLLITDGDKSLTLTVGASQTSVAYSLTGLTSGSGSHTVTVAFATSVCTPAAVTYAAPASCSCVVSTTLITGQCQFNQTNTTATDDYFRPTIRATNTVPGPTGRYEVVLNALANGTGGTVLNPGGTLYGQSVTVGNAGQFLANGSATYQLTIRDIDSATCRVVRTTAPVASCSSCETILCPKVNLNRLAP